MTTEKNPSFGSIGASQVAQLVKNLHAVQMWVPSLAWVYQLKKRVATYSSILAWRIPNNLDSNLFNNREIQLKFSMRYHFYAIRLTLSSVQLLSRVRLFVTP